MKVYELIRILNSCDTNAEVMYLEENLDPSDDNKYQQITQVIEQKKTKEHKKAYVQLW